MKNALDWLVSYEGFVAKPVARRQLLATSATRARITARGAEDDVGDGD
jgi:hypothetical protein